MVFEYAVPNLTHNALLRKEMQQQPELLAPLGLQITNQALVNAAAA